MSNLCANFARTLVLVDTMRILNDSFDFEEFINEQDSLCWVALEKGDVVPKLYIETICEAINENFPECSGRYANAYKAAVLHFSAGEDVIDNLQGIMDSMPWNQLPTEVLYTRYFTEKADAYLNTLDAISKERALEYLCMEEPEFPYKHFDQEHFDAHGECWHGFPKECCPLGCGDL